MDHDPYLTTSQDLDGMVKALAADGLEAKQFDIFEEDLYIVWFNFTLGNCKALLSTDAEEGLYIEVTHDAYRDESYVDIYKKLDSATIKHVEDN